MLTLCCGIGGLIVFIYGWVRAKEWGLQNIMIIWTACVVLGFVGGALNPGQFRVFQQQFNFNR